MATTGMRLIGCWTVVALFAALWWSDVVHGELSTIDNGIIRIGVDTDYGGAITYLSASSSPVTVINMADKGREIQQSYYAGPDPYMNASWSGNPWPWNPISSGDAFGHASQVVSLQRTANTIYVKSVPLQWALNGVPCECTFETWITLDGTGALVQNRLTNDRSDTTAYGAYSQELPAIYTNGAYYHLMTYTGSSPWTDGPVTEVNYPYPTPAPPNFPWASFQADESWSALVDDDKFGVGVWHPDVSVTHFVGGFSGKRGKGGPHDGPTGYMAPTSAVEITHDMVFNWCYYLVLGNLDTIRAYVNQHHDAGVQCPAPPA
jgi:hypothetical protein